MSAPLFSVAEIEAHETSLSDLRKKYQAREMEFNTYWSQQEAIEAAHQVETAKRVRLRAEEFLDGLITMIGERGSKFLTFESLFAGYDGDVAIQLIAKHNTPEVRRTLHTILKALTEIPRSWAMSAFARFLRGTGKQAGAKYYGAGMLGVAYGWKEDEVLFFCRVLTDGHNPYAKMFVHYTDVLKEAGDDRYEVFSETSAAAATNVVRDVEFLNQLCGMLESRGLGPAPTPAEAKPKKEHIPKVFKPGDVIRKKDLRDLPLPAHVRIEIDRQEGNPGAFTWVSDTLELVVTALGDNGYFAYWNIKPNTNKAYREQLGSTMGQHKEYLENATFVGPWTGEFVSKETLRLKFFYRLRKRPNS